MYKGKVKKPCKQVRDQTAWKKLKMKIKDCYKTKVYSKAFAIPILTAIMLTIN